MSNAFPAVADVAFLRASSSDQPERFRWLVRDIEGDVTDHGLNDRATAGWTARDAVHLAAEIEALAGVRRVRALYHPADCACDPCRVTTTRRKISKDPR
ncbi:hypothetical protein [Streptomyces sp. NPDC055055]